VLKRLLMLRRVLVRGLFFFFFVVVGVVGVGVGVVVVRRRFVAGQVAVWQTNGRNAVETRQNSGRP